MTQAINPSKLGMELAALQRDLSTQRLRALRMLHDQPERVQSAIERAATLVERAPGLYSHQLASDALDYAEALADAYNARR